VLHFCTLVISSGLAPAIIESLRAKTLLDYECERVIGNEFPTWETVYQNI